MASSRRAFAALTSASATSTILLGQLDPFLVELDGRLLRPKSSTSSGTNRVASTSPFFTLSPMSTFHFSM